MGRYFVGYITSQVIESAIDVNSTYVEMAAS